MQQKNSTLTTSQQHMVDLWEAHVRYEFEEKSVDKTMSTMVSEGAHLLNIPTVKGARNNIEVRHFYTTSFVNSMPADIETTLISRIVGETQIVDETILKFTHTVRMDWILPGIEPTGKRVEVPLVAIIGFKDDKVVHEHIYWDQASVLVQIGLMDASKLPVVGVESAQTLKSMVSFTS